MTNQYNNSGFSATGNAQVSIGVAAIGEHATANQTVQHAGAPNDAVLNELRQRVTQLADLVERHGHLIDSATKNAVTNVANEAARAQPNKTKISSILEEVAGTLKSVTAVGGAALALKAFVAGF
jgi:hypothetical protein